MYLEILSNHLPLFFYYPTDKFLLHFQFSYIETRLIPIGLLDQQY